MNETLLQDKLAQSMSYKQYKELIARLLEQGLTTGSKQSEALTGYTQMNQRRMDRLDKTAVLAESLRHQLEQLPCSLTWLVITEGWCGDAAQIIPWLQKMADATDRIELRLILRDEHPELIDQYLTDGARSIPKLISIDATTGRETGSWGPRPQPAQQMLWDYKALEERPPYAAFATDLQRWYSRDKGITLQAELSGQIDVWSCARA